MAFIEESDPTTNFTEQLTFPFFLCNNTSIMCNNTRFLCNGRLAYTEESNPSTSWSEE